MVAAGRLGRKTKRGWYDYSDDGPHRSPDAPAPALGGGEGDVAVLGDWPVASALRERAKLAGWRVRDRDSSAALVIDCDGSGSGSRVVLNAGDDVPPGSLGFHTLAPLSVVELMRDERTPQALARRTEAFFATLGLATAWIGDSPGGVLGRIVFQTINECSFALSEGIATKADIDDGMTLGVSHPRGPFAWLDLVGAAHATRVLDALRQRHGDGYRVAPVLRRRARSAP
jgi:3-hydroxybutyryl-CoA dehydrogenase